MPQLAQDQIAGIRPGPQMPNKYRRVGPRYAKHGELKDQGFVYDDTTDSYFRDKSTLPVEFGGTPKQPGLVSQLTPAVAAAGGIALATEGGKGAYGAIKEGIGGLFSGGASTTPTVNPSIATPQVLGMNQGVASAPGGGTLMSSGTSVPAATQPQGLFSVGSPASQVLSGAGAAYCAYNAYQGIKKGNPLQAGLVGAATYAGLTQAGLLAAAGPVGWGVAIGVPVIAALGGKLGDKDAWKTEGKNLKKLSEQGVYIPPQLLTDLPKHGRSKAELVEIAKATGGNVAFAESRNEKDLTGRDIVGFSTFAKNDPEWFKRPLDQQISYAQQLLDAGLVREHHGTVDVEWSKAPPPPWGASAGESAVSQVQAPRSSTISPGISKTGQRIDYSKPQKKKSKGLLAGA